MERTSGVLLHISSLPNAYGIGTFGKSAFEFVDFLVETGQTYWQILPLTTTSFGDSPYQSFSAFAGNTHFIDFDLLIEENHLTRKDVADVHFGDDSKKVDYHRIFNERRPLLDKAVVNFIEMDGLKSKEFVNFMKDNEVWLEPFVQYMTVKEGQGLSAWYEWPDNYREYNEEVILAYCKEHPDVVNYHRVTQYWFFKQWGALKAYANENHIQIIGDIPIYVARDSVEMWMTPELFLVDKKGNPTGVAGVPPDSFSADGQYWGNPLYDWDYMEEKDYAWWVTRMEESFKLYDVVRIDHFRGFESYWEVPFGAPTAATGKWKKGPSNRLFDQIEKELGKLNVIAEDLGFITKEVIEMRDKTGYPGMRILQNGFYGKDNLDLPHQYIPNTVAYVGTHDNRTALDWYQNQASLEDRDQLDGYLNRRPGEHISDAMNRGIAASPSAIAVYVMQDLLRLGEESRMNIPSTIGDNWDWRMEEKAITVDVKEKLLEWTESFFRMNESLLEEDEIIPDDTSDVFEDFESLEEHTEITGNKNIIKNTKKEIRMLNLESLAKEQFQKPLAELSNQEIYKILLDVVQNRALDLPTNDSKKKLYYVSAEFLIGKMLSNNLLNLGLYDEVKEQLAEHGKSLDEVEEAEQEPSLGNGGLGRLAACFLDSIATLGLNGDGVGLNYHFGLFRQVFEDNQQNYVPDEWISEPTWLTKSDVSFDVPFGKFTLTSSLYDLEVLGFQQGKRNRLRLFDLESVSSDIIDEGSITFDKTNIEENLTLFLYPDDSDRDGNLLRIYQQYFMVSNAAQLAIAEAIERGSNVHDLADYLVIQINDTHPTFIIPELIRLLTTEHGMEFDEAVIITRNIVAFTNHTILSEALEKWPLTDIQEVVPEIADIIVQLAEVIKNEFPDNPAVHLIDDHNTVHMAHIAIHFGFSTNGVAALHTEILKHSELKHFYEIYPEEFSNKTNGITFRRWLMAANPELTDFLNEKIGTDWHKDADLTGLLEYKDDEAVLKDLQNIKHTKKAQLRDHFERTQDVSIKADSIVDVHIKRIHEYKRQQMLALYIIHKYMEIKKGNIPATPITIIFGGKAAPAYTIAQDIIHLVLTLSELIENDANVNEHLQVVFVENYNVGEAEYLFPAADISEQISLASKEASGTGNMKFMLNGALTVATLDGANVEIADHVGQENIYLFGRQSDEIVHLYDTNGYDPLYYYNKLTIKPLVDFIVSDEMMALGNEDNLMRLYNDIKNKDYFMALIDLVEFIAIKEKMYEDFEDQKTWQRKALINIANAGFFSADRTIEDYNREIWHLESNVDA